MNTRKSFVNRARVFAVLDVFMTAIEIAAIHVRRARRDHRYAS
jgi:uncharacterized membrane protein (DUF485 family)